VLVQVGEYVEDLTTPGDEGVLGDRCRRLADDLLEVFALDEFEYEVDQTADRIIIVDLRNRWVTECREERGLALEVREPKDSGALVALAVNHLLDCAEALHVAEAQVARRVDGTHATDADDALDLVPSFEDRSRSKPALAGVGQRGRLRAGILDGLTDISTKAQLGTPSMVNDLRSLVR
jgi:hypothetical protein